ncbi:uncharacterized protein Dvar_07320 [Desulfosarcina variabilis str. Montpellier]|uniref:hypothetical protein n=1 Tax=Desulfosarcina variabilis TaxID=2300 RepID=UPI003AFA847B
MSLARLNKIALGMVFLAVVFMAADGNAFDITIDVAPNVLNMQNNGQVVTVHTDIAYGVVQASTVYLNDIAINSWKSDLRGNFVAKFVMNQVKKLQLDIDEYNTLTLVGLATNGDTFAGSQDILVVDNGGI